MIVVVVISVVPQHNGDDDFCLLLNDENEYDDEVVDVGLSLSDLLLILLVSGDEVKKRTGPYYIVSFEIVGTVKEIFKMEKTVIL